LKSKSCDAAMKAFLANVVPDVFDNPVNMKLTSEFLTGSRHHLAVAINDGRVAGFSSTVHYFHPDKSHYLWMNDVSSNYRNRRLAKLILRALLELGRQLRCRVAWVLIDRPNIAAIRF
jgi:ribosomal protein S18 acetylase RimI-like enzyme